MLGFALSKFSLLILVVSIFAIVSFFTLHLMESLKIKALTDLLSDSSTIASEMMASPSFCDRLIIKIPETVRLSASEMYYLFRISAQTTTVDGAKKTYLIFSASDKSKPGHLLAASSSPSFAEVNFYTNKNYGLVADAKEGIVLDPSARTEDPNFADAFYLVKETVSSGNPDDKKGKVVLYVFPCSVLGGIESNCRAALGAVGGKVYPGGKFKCGD